MQATKRLADITEKLKEDDFYIKQPLSCDPDQLVEVGFNLFPKEVVVAAQKELGDKKMSQHFVDIYEYVRQCQERGLEIKKQQLSGVILTHKAIGNWLAKKNIGEITIYEPQIMKMLLQYHIDNFKAGIALFEQIMDAI